MFTRTDTDVEMMTSTQLSQEFKTVCWEIGKPILLSVGPIVLFVIQSILTSDSVFRFYPRIFFSTVVIAIAITGLYDIFRDQGSSSKLLRLVELNQERWWKPPRHIKLGPKHVKK